jgi:hypothetical protein
MLFSKWYWDFFEVNLITKPFRLRPKADNIILPGAWCYIICHNCKTYSSFWSNFQALGTAEMVADLVLGNPGKVVNAPFAVPGRC